MKIKIIFILSLLFFLIAEFASASKRFRDNGNGTITDTKTGLMWEKSPSNRSNINWYNAMEHARNLRLAGYSNWRLPTKDELVALIPGISEERPYEWLNRQGFDVEYRLYWTSTESNENSAWYVSMYGSSMNVNGKEGGYGLRAICIRSGQ